MKPRLALRRRRNLRALLVVLILITGSFAAPAEAQSFRAGVTRLTVQDATPFDAWVAYPSEAAEVALEEGPITFLASRDTPLAGGARFPVVLFSHGSGRGPGTPLVHRDLLLHLARSGFVVIAPFHPGTGQPFVNRPRQVRKALDAVLADPRFATRADPERVGMMGFSFGGAVSLIFAGARTNLAHLSAYCRDHRDDPRACDGIPTDGSWASIPSRKSEDARPLKALVLLEPFGALFERDGLASLNLPTLIYSASRSDLRAEGNALAIAKALPRQPRQVVVPGSHFVFVDPCPPILKGQTQQLCSDPSGVDRAAIHRQLRQEISDFLRASM